MAKSEREVRNHNGFGSQQLQNPAAGRLPDRPAQAAHSISGGAIDRLASPTLW